MIVSPKTLSGSTEFISSLFTSFPDKVCGLWAIFMRCNMMQINEKQINRFWGKVDKTGDCWNWTGQTSCGYGCVSIDYKTRRCHRVSYYLCKGDIPSGLNVNHRCDNKLCVNPDHLYAGTQKENIKDALDRNLMGSSKLSPEDIPKILSYKGSKMYLREIGEIFGVDRKTISSVLTGKTWSHISGIKYRNGDCNE